ncbi:c-type cytochrome [Sphingobium subterraneum]|uniref:Cytochrome c n=1 Tax=Sphingobium subterraneum TaxID=627688 RepID=A0A841IYI3_9SPHN|nr:cytochrome c family protein [Sphingobium subterraneum]MBB6123667.1 cytochrome c [Sphingobium subterraneum]
MTVFSRSAPLLFVLALGVSPTAAYAGGDAVKGKTVFARCAICHGVKTGEVKLGPTLFKVVGRKAGTVPAFQYSAAMKASKATWDAKTLDAYVTNPMKYIPGTRMAFAGVPQPADRANLIAYLATLK